MGKQPKSLPWKRAIDEIVANEPNDTLSRFMRAFLNEQYEYEAHEWRSIEIRDNNEEWARLESARIEEAANCNIAVDWENQWRPYCLTLRKLHLFAPLQQLARIEKAKELIRREFSLCDFFAFEHSHDRIMDALDEWGGLSDFPNDFMCDIREAARSLHDEAVAIIAIYATLARDGFNAEKKSDGIIAIRGIFDSKKTIAELRNAIPEGKIAVDIAGSIENVLKICKGIKVNSEATVINSAHTRESAEWIEQELKRKKKKREQIGRDSQRKAAKNGNGRKTDTKLKNQIMTEVRQTMKRCNNSQSNACQIVAEKHLKADGKTPIYNKRTIENWMSKAAEKTKCKTEPKKQ